MFVLCPRGYTFSGSNYVCSRFNREAISRFSLFLVIGFIALTLILGAEALFRLGYEVENCEIRHITFINLNSYHVSSSIFLGRIKRRTLKMFTFYLAMVEKKDRMSVPQRFWNYVHFLWSI